MSVVVPVHNGATYLAAALDSLLGQDPAPREVVVVDDGSTDGTPAVMRAYEGRIRAVSLPRTGFSGTINRGVDASTSSWIGFVDADDEWPPESLAMRWAAVAAHPEVELVSGRVVQFVSPELPDEATARFRFDPAPSRAQVFGAVLIRRQIWETVGPLDETLPSASTIDWISRARTAGVRQLEFDDVVLRRRLHGGNMGVVLDQDVTRKALRDVVRAHHARRQGPDTP